MRHAISAIENIRSADLQRFWPARAVCERVSAAFFVLGIVAIATFAWLRPAYNFDLVPYIATALENRISDAAELHARSWSIVEEAAPAAVMERLKTENAYNAHQYENAEGFASQLPMYRVKVAYVWLLRALEPVTGLLNAAMLLSILPAVGVGILGLLWLREHDAMQGAVFLLPALVISDFFYMTMTVTPDILLALLALAALYSIRRGAHMAAAALLVCSVAVRPDNIVLVFALLLVAPFTRWPLVPYLVAFGSSLAAGLIISSAGDHPGWWAHFWFSCIQLQNDMTGFAPFFSLAELVRGYVRGLSVTLQYNDWLFLAAALAAGWLVLLRQGQMLDRTANGLMAAMVLAVGGKFLSFPLPDDRYYFVFIAGMALIVLSAWKPRFDRPNRIGGTQAKE